MFVFEKYAIIENGVITKYPVNPRVVDETTGEPNIPFDWYGGEFLGKTFVLVFNLEPECHYTKNLVENNTPWFNPDNGNWYRGYDQVDASPEEIAQRIELQIKSVKAISELKINEANQVLSEITNLTEEGKREWDDYFAFLESMENHPGFPWDVIHSIPTRPDLVKRVNIEVERL